MQPPLAAEFITAYSNRDAILVEWLRARVWLRSQEAVPRAELLMRLFRAADESTALALQSGFPLLVLLELFAEQARAAVPTTFP